MDSLESTQTATQSNASVTDQSRRRRSASVTSRNSHEATEVVFDKHSPLERSLVKDVAPPDVESDTRSDQDKLVDLLVRLNFGNPYDDDHNAIKETYLEGHGGKKGSDPGYWLMRWQSGRTEETKNKLVLRSQDNTVFRHTNPGVREFFELGGYRAFPEIVTISIEVRDIFNVDVCAGTFRISFILTKRWYDQAFDLEEYIDEGEVYSQTIPHITLDHVHEGDDPVGVPKDGAGLSKEERHYGLAYHEKADPPGVLYHWQRIQATLCVANDLHDFPFDKQKLYISIRMWGADLLNDIDHGRVLLPLTCEVKLAHSVLEWRVHQATAMITTPRFDTQQLTMVVPLTRDHQFFTYNVYIILFFITSAAFLSFAVRPGDGGFRDTLESRLSITLTLVLTSIAYKFYLEPMLPHAPYLTEIDWYLYGSFFTILGILFGNFFTLLVEFWEPDENSTYPAVMHTPGNEMTPAEVSDAIIFYIMLCIWLCFNCVRGFRIRRNLKEHEQGLTTVVSNEEKLRLKNEENDIPNSVEKAYLRSKKKKKQNKDKAIEAVSYEEGYCTLIERRNKALEAAKDDDEKNDAALKIKKQNDATNNGFQRKTTESVKLEFHEVCVNLRRPVPCECTGCVLRQQQSTTADTDKLLHNLEYFFVAAGMTKVKARQVCETFISFGITRKVILMLFNHGDGIATVTRLLERMSIGVEETVKILAALNLCQTNRDSEDRASPESAKVLCLQGAFSYVMLHDDIRLENQLVLPSDLKLVLNKVLTKVPLTVSFKKTLREVASQLYASVLLQAIPYTEPKFIYSRRECKPDPKIRWPTPNDRSPVVAPENDHPPVAAPENDHPLVVAPENDTPSVVTTQATTPENDTPTVVITQPTAPKNDSLSVVTTQAWCGYLAKKFDEQDEWETSMGGAFCIHIGTYEITFHYAEMQKVEGKRLAVIRSYSGDTFELSTQKMKLFKNMDACIAAMDVRTKCKTDQETKFREMDNLGQIKEICAQLQQGVDDLFEYVADTCGVTLTSWEPIFIVCSTGTQMWTKKSEREHGARCHELLDAMRLYLDHKYSDGDQWNHKVYIEVSEPSDEAQYEHQAFLTAIQSSDLSDVKLARQPHFRAHAELVTAFDNNEIGTLSCGVGSMQGMPNANTVIMCELGLAKIEEWIKADAKSFGGNFVEVVKDDHVVMHVYFDNNLRGVECMYHLQTKILTELKNLSPLTNWKEEWLSTSLATSTMGTKSFVKVTAL